MLDTHSLTADRTFAQRLRARDPEALGQFFDAWFPRVHGIVRRQVSDPHTAEDLTQEIFLNVHRAIESYDPERELAPWVHRIAQNKLRDHWRRRYREHFNPADEETGATFAEEHATSELLPIDPLLEGESSGALRAAVEGLPESLRGTLLMRAFEGMSFEAIGELVGRNATAVRKRYSRALAVLREKLDPVALGLGESA